jgi:hypothetical protein
MSRQAYPRKALSIDISVGSVEIAVESGMGLGTVSGWQVNSRWHCYG